jgi:hypothetical protein
MPCKKSFRGLVYTFPFRVPLTSSHLNYPSAPLVGKAVITNLCKYNYIFHSAVSPLEKKTKNIKKINIGAIDMRIL